MNTFIKYFFNKSNKYNLLFNFLLALIIGCITTLLIDPLWEKYLFLMHSALELLCILIGFSTFVVTWNTYEKNSSKNCIIGFGFFIIATFDILHTFYYQTNLFEYFYCREITSKFWILGRIFEAVILLVVSIKSSLFKLSKTKSMLTALIIIAATCFLVFSFPFKLRLWTANGMTTLKIVLEFIIILVLVIALIALIKNKSTNLTSYKYLFIAILLTIIAEINFTIYKNNLASFYPAFGHVLRVICYASLFRGVFIKIAEYPYKKIENALNLSENLFKIAFENTPVGMALISVEGQWLKINNAICEFLGYTKDELFKMTYQDVFYTNDKGKYAEAVNNLISGNIRSHRYEKSMLDKWKKPIWVSINKSLVKDSNGNALYIVAQIENITDRKKTEELEILAIKNELAIREAKELEHLRTEFFANLSHEFRTPLNVILGALQLIELKVNNGNELKIEKFETNIKTMKQNCLRLLRLINNLIDITKIDAGFFQLDLKNYNIVSIIEEITLSIAEYTKSNGISLIFDTDTEEKIIACDPDKIERIILNIISNSIKFTNKGGTIKVEVYASGENVKIIIKDNGTGIPEDKLGIIFERFRQANKSTIRNNEGSGIGLSLVKSLVEMHSGTITVESKYKEGCKFIITLPSRVLEGDNAVSSHLSTAFQSNHVEKINVEFSDIYFNSI